MKKMLLMMLATAIVASSCTKEEASPTTKEVAVVSVSLNASTTEIEIDESGILTATVLPENAADKSVVWSSNNPEIATVDQNGVVTAKAVGNAAIIVTTQNGKSDTCSVTVTAAYLDYVLIGGKKWATMNLGATTVAGSYETCAGDYYAWGELGPYYGNKSWTGTKFTFSDWKTGRSGGYCWESYCNTSNFVEWSPAPFSDSTLTDSYDVVKQNVQHGWRLPTVEDFTALANACKEGGYTSGSFSPDHTGTDTTSKKGVYWCNSYKGVAGLLFCDGTKKLFFPAIGYGFNTSLNDVEESSCYWSSNVRKDNTEYAYNLNLTFNGIYPQSFSFRRIGRSVRPVKDIN